MTWQVLSCEVDAMQAKKKKLLLLWRGNVQGVNCHLHCLELGWEISEDFLPLLNGFSGRENYSESPDRKTESVLGIKLENWMLPANSLCRFLGGRSKGQRMFIGTGPLLFLTTHAR